jgi:hypothetical protein
VLPVSRGWRAPWSYYMVHITIIIIIIIVIIVIMIIVSARNEIFHHNFSEGGGAVRLFTVSKDNLATLCNPRSWVNPIEICSRNVFCLQFPRLLWCTLCCLNPVAKETWFSFLGQNLEVIIRNELRKSWSKAKILLNVREDWAIDSCFYPSFFTSPPLPAATLTTPDRRVPIIFLYSSSIHLLSV